MLNHLKKISVLIGAVLFYFVAKEFISLFVFLSAINIYLATSVLLIIGVFLFYYGIIPLIEIFRLPKNLGPTKDKTQIKNLRERRLTNWASSNLIEISALQLSSEDHYNKSIAKLGEECDLIRKKYVTQVFYTTSISQNGFLDAVFIFSASVNMVKEIFQLYNGRVSNVELWIIAKKVYASIVIGGSNGVEYATEEIFSKFATDALKSVPFLDKIIGSLADGFVNASLLTRISLITENYCKLLYIEKDRDLYPSPKFIYTTAKSLTSEMMKTANNNLIEIAKDKSGIMLQKVVNPMALVLGKSVDTVKEGSRNLFGKIFPRKNKF